MQKKHLVLSGKLCCHGFKLKYPVFHCRHLFHKSCVDPWLLDHRTCPMCKMNILKALGIPVSTLQSSWSGQKGNSSYLSRSLALCPPFLSYSSCYVIDLLRGVQTEMSDSTSLLHSAFIRKEECVYGDWLGVGICVTVVACFV